MDKKTVISLFFMFLMVGSTVTYALLQAVKQPEQQVELPSSNVVDYELTEEQESLLMQNGKVILKYLYSQSCDGCLQKKNVLDSVAADETFSGQVVIEQVLSSKQGLPLLTIVSYKGQKVLTNYTNEDLLDALCELMVQPPVGCAVRKI